MSNPQGNMISQLGFIDRLTQSSKNRKNKAGRLRLANRLKESTKKKQRRL